MFCTLWAATIYLRAMHAPSSVHFPLKGAPTKIWVSDSRGLPVPPRTFPPELVSVALLKVLTPRRAAFPAVILRCIALWFPLSRTLQASQPVPAWTFLTFRKTLGCPTRNDSGIAFNSCPVCPVWDGVFCLWVFGLWTSGPVFSRRRPPVWAGWPCGRGRCGRVRRCR